MRAAPSPNQNAGVLLGLSPVQRMTIADGDLGTAQTIARIRRLVHQGMTDQLVNRVAIAIVQAAGIQPFDFVGEIKAVFAWVQQNIRFTRDVTNVETLRTAREILVVRAGDCDDINGVLLPALLGTIGHNVRLVTISSEPAAPKEFSHIYCEVEIAGQWVPLDAARRDPQFGRGPQHYFRKRIWAIDSCRYRDMKGLGYYSSTAQPRIIRRRRLGDFDDIAGDLSQIIGSAGQATAQIITATNTGIRPSIPGYAVNPVTGQLVPVGANGQLTVTTTPTGIVGAGVGSIPNWMLYGGLLVLGLVMVRK